MTVEETFRSVSTKRSRTGVSVEQIRQDVFFSGRKDRRLSPITSHCPYTYLRPRFSDSKLRVETVTRRNCSCLCCRYFGKDGGRGGDILPYFAILFRVSSDKSQDFSPVSTLHECRHGPYTLTVGGNKTTSTCHHTSTSLLYPPTQGWGFGEVRDSDSKGRRRVKESWVSGG